MSREIEQINDDVAVKVMGYTRGARQSLHAAEGGTFWDGSCKHKWEDDVGPTATYWSPSTDPAAAMEVVERMGVLGYNTHIEWKGAGREFEHTAEVSMHKVGGGTRGGHATADTFTLAASLAALRAVSANGKEPGHE